MAEEKKKSNSKNLKVQLARMSFRLGSKYPHSDPVEKQDINTALNYITQALMLADDQESEARRLLDMAKRLSRL